MSPPVIHILNGPNLNLLGEREPSIYGRETLGDIEALCRATARELDLAVEFKQSNREGELIDWVQQARRGAGLIINAGGYTHTSIALMDALLALAVPIIEVHLSNLAKRESFRQLSYVAPAATGAIMGLGASGYRLALIAMAALRQGAPA